MSLYVFLDKLEPYKKTEMSTYDIVLFRFGS